MTGDAVETFEIRQEEATGKLAAANRAASKFVRRRGVGVGGRGAERRGACPSRTSSCWWCSGAGFGKVMQVRHKATGGVYAMKIFKKTELRKRRQVERTKTSARLSAVNHPFIVRLSFAQTAAKLYMVMDFVQAATSSPSCASSASHEHRVRLYISEIAMALQHLHEELDVV